MEKIYNTHSRTGYIAPIVAEISVPIEMGFTATSTTHESFTEESFEM